MVKEYDERTRGMVEGGIVEKVQWGGGGVRGMVKGV